MNALFVTAAGIFLAACADTDAQKKNSRDTAAARAGNAPARLP